MKFLARFFSIENRYLPPILITTILLAGQLSFGLPAPRLLSPPHS
jgi:hypothetical protein